MNESNIFGISIRAYIVFMLVTAFVIMNFMKITISDTFSTLVVAVVMFYFGNKTVAPPDQPKNEVKDAKSIVNSNPVS